jgi:hypothetical protein
MKEAEVKEIIRYAIRWLSGPECVDDELLEQLTQECLADYRAKPTNNEEV